MSESEFYNRVKACLISKNQFWKTPKVVYEQLDNEFHFDFDPCPVNPEFDGLNMDWGKSNYVNPPYNEKDKWIKKAWLEWKKGKTVVMLLPSKTDTRSFHEYIYNQAELRFIKGRLKFNDGKDPAPFPSMIVIFRGNNGL